MKTEKHFDENLKFENARLLFKNFKGEEDKYNAAGNRNFCAVIDDEKQAAYLEENGWNVRSLPARDDDDAVLYYINVKVSFDVRPPRVYLVDEDNKRTTALTEDTIGELDYAQIKNVDMVISPYNWSVGNKSGVKGYLKTMYVVLEKDEFADKYNFDEKQYSEEDLPF